MTPYFAVIGLITVISIIVNLQINKHSLLCKIIGTVILAFTCVFAYFVILYPLSFGSYRSLITSFVVVFILLIGIYVLASLLANRQRINKVVFVATEGTDGTPETDKVKTLAKPVQLRDAAASKECKKRMAVVRTSQSERQSLIYEKHLEQFALNDSSLEKKEDIPDITQSDRQDLSLPDGGLNTTKTVYINNDIGEHPETGATEEDIGPSTGQALNGMIDQQLVGSVSVTDEAVDEQAEQETNEIAADQTDGDETAADEAVNEQAEQETNEIATGQAGSDETAADEAVNEQAEQETNEIAVDRAGNDETAADEAVDEQAEQETNETAAGQTDGDETAADEAVDEQAEQEADKAETGQKQSVLTTGRAGKYARLINKAAELKDQDKYLNAIFILQSDYDGMMDKAIRKQADLLLLECFVLSGQYREGQNKWFDILNKKYDFESEEKAKIKAMIVKLNTGRL